ncbi:MAG: Gfo/Idh/MocA family oxidoreductase [Sphaerochaetaceae bacterium]|nr:Gfo/Idh/MocA family oxidoreductase [Sphaerochaetaceae bacterium]
MKTLVIAGLGSRGRLAYGREIAGMKDRAKVVAVADTSDEALELAGEEHGIPGSMRFHSAEELFSQPCLADAAIICTQDRQHVPHALMALEKGYDILLEKPISPRLEELQAIQEAAS